LRISILDLIWRVVDVDLLSEVGQEPVNAFPRLRPEPLLDGIFAFRDQISTTGHDKKDILQAFWNGLLL
jgi:hypothetical protein